MVCFCHTSTAALELALQDLASAGLGGAAALGQADRSGVGAGGFGASGFGAGGFGASGFGASAAIGLSLTAPAQRVLSVSNWLSRRLLPSPAWQPEAAWLKLELPVPQMSMEAIATLTSIVTLRSLAIELFGADPFRPGTAAALARVVVTLNARLPGLAAALPQGGQAGQAHWSVLANVAEAAVRVQLAVSSGLFDLAPAQMQAYLAPGGLPMEQWAGVTARIKALLPLVAVSASLGAELSDPVNLAEAMRVVKSQSVPALADPGLVARLTAVFAALNRVQGATGANPASMPVEQVHAQVMSLALQAAEAIPAGAQPPRIAQNPASFATRAVVTAALSAPVAALAALNWRVPQSSALPALANLLPAASLIKALPAGAAVQKRPCAQGCDAASLMRGAGF